MTPFPLLQVAADTVSVAPLTPQASLSVWDLALKGGWIMLVLLLLSLLAVYLFVYKYIEIRRAIRQDASFFDRIKDYLQMGREDSALELCRRTRSVQARLTERALRYRSRSPQDLRDAIENAGNVSIGKLERKMPALATIAAGAPMIGFLGTVTGMVRAFFDLANSGTGVDITLLSGGIYEALVTTVGGLIVGIITLFAYNYLVSQIDRVANKIEALILDLTDLFHQ